MADVPQSGGGHAFAGRTVVVVGINYAPETTGIAPYTTQLCEFIASEGANVIAVVGLPHYPSWTVDPEYRRGLRGQEVINGVHVVRVPHFVPSRQTAARRGLYEGSFYLGSRRACRGLEPAAVIGVSPTLSGLRTANALAARAGAPFGAVIQDLMGLSAEQSGMRGGRRVAGLVAHSELAVLARASRVGVISDAFRDVLVGAGIDAESISVMPNFTHVATTSATRNEARRELGWELDAKIALHTGNMGLKQDLENVIAAARLATTRSDRALQFVLMGNGSQRRSLERKAKSVEAVQIVDPVSDETYPLALAAADVLLINERPTVRDMSLPSKLTSYFASGRCVVGAAHAGGATAHEILRSGAGVCVSAGDPEALLDAVERLLKDDEARTRMGSAGREYARTHLSRAAARERSLQFAADLLNIPWPPVAPSRESSAVEQPRLLPVSPAVPAVPAEAHLGV